MLILLPNWCGISTRSVQHWVSSCGGDSLLQQLAHCSTKQTNIVRDFADKVRLVAVHAQSPGSMISVRQADDSELPSLVSKILVLKTVNCLKWKLEKAAWNTKPESKLPICRGSIKTRTLTHGFDCLDKADSKSPVSGLLHSQHHASVVLLGALILPLFMHSDLGEHFNQRIN